MVFNMCFPKSSSGAGNTLQRSTSEEKRRNMEIDRLIRKDKKTQARQVKILLLGGWITLSLQQMLNDLQVLASRENRPS